MAGNRGIGRADIQGLAERLKYWHVFLPCMVRRTVLLVCIVIVLLAVAADWAYIWGRGGAADDGLVSGSFCASVITVGPDRHYLLRREMVTQENAEQINQCIELLGIRNARVEQVPAGLRLQHGNQT